MVDLLPCFKLPELPSFLVAVIKPTKCLLKTHSAQGPISGASGYRELMFVSLGGFPGGHTKFQYHSGTIWKPHSRRTIT